MYQKVPILTSCPTSPPHHMTSKWIQFNYIITRLKNQRVLSEYQWHCCYYSSGFYQKTLHRDFRVLWKTTFSCRRYNFHRYWLNVAFYINIFSWSIESRSISNPHLQRKWADLTTVEYISHLVICIILF